MLNLKVKQKNLSPKQKANEHMESESLQKHF